MKTLQSAFIVCASLMILIAAGCSKKSSSSCGVCTQECVIANIVYPGAGGTATQTYCGNTAQISTWESSISIALIQSGGSVSFANTNSSTAQSFTVCSSTGFDSLGYYSGLGYSCK